MEPVLYFHNEEVAIENTDSTEVKVCSELCWVFLFYFYFCYK